MAPQIEMVNVAEIKQLSKSNGNHFPEGPFRFFEACSPELFHKLNQWEDRFDEVVRLLEAK